MTWGRIGDVVAPGEPWIVDVAVAGEGALVAVASQDLSGSGEHEWLVQPHVTRDGGRTWRAQGEPTPTRMGRAKVVALARDEAVVVANTTRDDLFGLVRIFRMLVPRVQRRATRARVQKT